MFPYFYQYTLQLAVPFVSLFLRQFYVLQVLPSNYYVGENDLELVILLFSPSTCCWDSRLEPCLFSAVLG